MNDVNVGYDSDETPLVNVACLAGTCQNGGHCEITADGSVGSARCNCDMTSFVGSTCIEGIRTSPLTAHCRQCELHLK